MPSTRADAGAAVLNGAPLQPFCSASGLKFAAANAPPSSDVKHVSLATAPFSASTLTTPFDEITSRPLVAPHRSTGTQTVASGRIPLGSVNAWPVPLAIAPLRCTMPAMSLAAALLVANGALVHGAARASPVNPLAFGANEAPSSEVKHCALANEVSACTLTDPPGEMISRPLVAPH